jgi:hypothetical protein
MNTSLPQQAIHDRDVRRMEQRIIDTMLRYTPTYPSAATDQGQRGDYAINSDGGKISIHNGAVWKTITLETFST